MPIAGNAFIVSTMNIMIPAWWLFSTCLCMLSGYQFRAIYDPSLEALKIIYNLKSFEFFLRYKQYLLFPLNHIFHRNIMYATESTAYLQNNYKHTNCLKLGINMWSRLIKSNLMVKHSEAQTAPRFLPSSSCWETGPHSLMSVLFF